MAYGAGAAVSLALVVAVGVWGYQLVMRDVSGVPVVRATEGPMRVMPEDPGGAPAEHQGLAVNKVAAEGVAQKPADRFILAPRPVDLSIEDSTTAKLDLIRLTQDNRRETEALPQKATDLSVDALTQALIADATPFSDVVDDAKSDDAPKVIAALQSDVVAEVADAEDAPEGLVAGNRKISLRPRPRPAGLVASAAAAIAAPPVDTALDLDAASLPAGTRLAQLGAFESAEIARKEWDRLASRFDDFLTDKKRVIQKAESGGRTFYRLRAHGFSDISDARRFCSALVAERAECIPVTIK
ncbi:MAG: SPOR domain-containing protein [Thalassovita sp.]